MKKIAVSQPRYLPAINYLQRIYLADVFVVLDNVQHQRRAFEHRNRIKLTNGELKWLTIPLDRKNGSREIISDLSFVSLDWIEEHKNIIKSNYLNSPYFDCDLLDDVYGHCKSTVFVENIMRMNARFCELLNIEYNFVMSSSLGVETKKAEMLNDIVKSLGGEVYISGTNGRDYIPDGLFQDIKLLYHDFDFPRYFQPKGDFVPWLCLWDQIFNVGLEKTEIMVKSDILLNEK